VVGVGLFATGENNLNTTTAEKKVMSTGESKKEKNRLLLKGAKDSTEQMRGPGKSKEKGGGNQNTKKKMGEREKSGRKLKPANDGGITQPSKPPKNKNTTAILPKEGEY